MKILLIDRDRFESKYTPEPMSGCWLWTGALNTQGYGHFKINNVGKLAHRVSYEVYKGAIPDDECVRHTCDVPYCVNPDHLIPGTWGDNNRDRARRGRSGMRWTGLCKRGHDLDSHGYHRPNGTRYCATCQGGAPRAKNGKWL